MANTELAKTLASLLKAMSPEDLAATQATLHAEVSARRPAFDLNEINKDMAPARQQEWASEILGRLREGQG